MKKICIVLLAIFSLFLLTACDKKDNLNSSKKHESKVQETSTEKDKDNEEDEIINDEIVDYDDEDNSYYVEDENVTVKEVINCDGCVFAYFSDEGDQAKTIGSTLTESEYTTDINNLRTMGKKQRHNFFGLVLSDNKIVKAYACILKDSKIYCIQGSDDGAHHTNNISILSQIFGAEECRTISAGHTYTCTDGNYNGDTITTGYASLHYETSCVIYGNNANSGKLICH